jgi:hypothetical protein
MRFPDKLTVVVRDRITGLPVEDVAIILTLFATRKNNYGVEPVITNENGVAEFTRESCEFSIKRQKGIFIMDFKDELGDCRPFIELSLHPHEFVERMIQQYRYSPELWGSCFRDPERLFAALEKVRNAEYEPSKLTATEEQLLAKPQLELLLSSSDKTVLQQ